jgi:hypothetical protein
MGFAAIVDTTTTAVATVVKSVAKRPVTARSSAEEPGLMTRTRVNPRHFVDGQTIVDVVPTVGCGVSWVDAECLDGINKFATRVRFWANRIAATVVKNCHVCFETTLSGNRWYVIAP